MQPIGAMGKRGRNLYTSQSTNDPPCTSARLPKQDEPKNHFEDE